MDAHGAGAEPVLGGERRERLGLGQRAARSEIALDRRDGRALVACSLVATSAAVRLVRRRRPAAASLRRRARPTTGLATGLWGSRWARSADVAPAAELGT
jgi:hypothetical protein